MSLQTLAATRQGRAVLIAAAWLLIAAVFASQSYYAALYRQAPIAWLQSFAAWLVWAFSWALLTAPILMFAQRLPLERPRALSALLLHALVGAACVTLNLAVFAAVAPWISSPWVGSPNANAPGQSPPSFSRLMGTMFLPDLAVYAVLIAGANIQRLVRTARAREHRALQLEASLADARLLALKAQIQPHFLFNTLNAIAVLMRDDTEAAQRMLMQLCALLRRVLAASDAQRISLQEELALTTAYLEIEQTRFADRLRYRIDVAPELLELPVPSLLLQPLVENALRHGLSRQIKAGEVRIRVTRSDEGLNVTVEDDGVGFAHNAQDGVGLGNTRKRLQQLYGDRATLRIETPEQGGTRIRVCLSLSEAERVGAACNG